MCEKYDIGQANGLHRKNDLWPTRSTIMKHDHSMLRPQATSRMIEDDGKELHGGQLTFAF